MRSEYIKSLLAALAEPNDIESDGWGPVQIGVGAVPAGWEHLFGPLLAYNSKQRSRRPAKWLLAHGLRQGCQGGAAGLIL